MAKKRRRHRLQKLWGPSQNLWVAAVNALAKNPEVGGIDREQPTPELQVLFDACKVYMNVSGEIIDMSRRSNY